MSTDARQVERLRETAERRLHADRPPYTRLVPVGAHVLIELLDAAEAHAALVKAVEGAITESEGAAKAMREDRDQLAEAHPHWADYNNLALRLDAEVRRLRAILAATDTAADRGAVNGLAGVVHDALIARTADYRWADETASAVAAKIAAWLLADEQVGRAAATMQDSEYLHTGFPKPLATAALTAVLGGGGDE